jgi:hypothetical protein
MNRNVDLTEALNSLEFSGNRNCLEGLFQKIEDLVFYLQAHGQGETAEQLLACNWQLKEHMLNDREEQWLWTFVWIKDKVLRKLGGEDEAKMEIQMFKVEKIMGPRHELPSSNQLLLGQSWDKNYPLGIGY